MIRTFIPAAKGEYEKVFNVTLPASIVEGSARGKVSITGDLMGPSLSNLDHLIRLPTGCGEQNMLGFVPNIVALSYLTTTDQLTPSVDNKAKFNMKRGYQRELNYRHRDGSYSAFGESDPEGSTWLTAFVIRSFAQAQDYIYIDEDDLNISISWLKSLQSPETGCFQSRGKLCHKDMKGGINSERTLTSYVLITLLEAGLHLQDQAVTDALRCMTKDLPEVEDTYTLSQLAYALTLAESPLVQDVLDKLESMAVYEDGLRFWQTNRAKPNGTRDLYAYQAPSTDIEMTSYILLALIGRTTDVTQALREGNPIARWIVLQRNSNGGFSSTQDTVVALHALAEYAKVAYSEGTSIKAVVEVSPLEGSQEGEVYPFTITSLNRLVLAEETLQALPAQLTLVASGSGCALMQISTTHNEIPESPEDAGFELDVLVLESYESSRKTRCNDYYMKVCARYTGSDEESNMAIIQVKMISGFYPNKESLRLLQKQHKPLQRYDVDNKNIYFYFNELTNEDTCLVFSVVKEIDVEDVKPGVVQVYDYYDKEINVKQLYDITCEDSPPSWDASLLYTIPVKPSQDDGEFFGNDGDMRPLPFVLAALRQMDGLVFIDPPGESEGGSEGAGTSSSDEDGGEGNVPVVEVDPIDVARELGPPDVFILCPAGQKFVDGLKRCIPINGCESSPCLEGQNCIDTDAGHLCVGCKPGYRKGVADQCVRMSDPTVDLMLCGPGQEYVNGACITIDQCVGNPCPVGARCRSTAFGHTCEPVTCPPGRELTQDLQCIDIDECLQNPCYEGEMCINRALGYDCICAEGYERDITGLCVDINECESEVEPCGGPEYTCMNDVGSYQCFCIEGYVLDQEGYCVQEVQETENATRDPQEIGQETTGAPAQQNVTRESASSIPSDGSEQSTEQPQEDVTKDTTSQPTTPSPVEENTTEEVSAVQSTTDVSATQSSGETTESTGNNSSVALNTSEEPVTSGESRTQSPGNVSPTQRAAEDTTAPESGSVTSNVDSDISTTGTRGVDPTTQDTQADTTSASPVKEVTSDSITPPSTSAPTVERSSVTHDTEEGSATPGSPVTQDSAVSGTTADSQVTHKRTDSPSVEEGSTPSGNENTGTSAPAEQDTATPEERHEGSVTPGTEERTNSDSAVEQGSSTQSPEEATDQPQPESSATQVVVDETDTTTKAVTPGAAQTTDEQGTATPSNATDAPSNEDQVTGKVPTRGDGTVEQGGQGGDGDGGKPIIDYGGIKAGTCPVEELGGFSICGGTPCRGDEDCPGTDKCCQRSCGKLCMAVPMELEPIGPIDVDGGSPPEGVADHPGVCPMDVGDSPMCTGTTCTNDGDCEGYEKCCFDFECGFDSVCMPAPQIQPVPVGPLGPVAPVGVAGHPGVCPEEVGGSPYCDGGLCIVDADCGPGEKCCSSITCAEGLRCMPAPQIQPVPPPSPRKGLCPMLTPTDLGNCEGQECVLDNECFDNEKCCGSACGYHCTMAILDIDMPDHPEIHLGTCPSVEAEGACGNAECIQDGDCAETEKCCGSSCGFHCTTLSIDIRIGGESLTPREQQCTGDLEFNDCAVTCQLTCAEPNVRPCVKMCGIGCYCPNGMLRESLESDRCYADISSCPLAVPEPEPVSRECTGDLTFNDCGTACEQSCDHPEPMMCTRQCVPGCFCPFGSLRVSLDTDTCVTIEADRPNDANCPSTGDTRPCENERRMKMEESGDKEGIFIPQCTQDGLYAMEQCYEGNGSYCWCADPQTGMVIPDSEVHGVRADCERFIPDPSLLNQCPEGKVFAEGVKKCVVPEPEPEPLAPECPGDFVMNECNSACPEYCGKPEGLLCITMCLTGCGCPVGTVMQSEDSTVCIPAEQCPVLCDGDLVFNDCGTACPSVCNEPEPLFCTYQCVLECQCPSEMHRVAGTSRCVAQEACPESCAEGYKHNEMLECVVAKPCPEKLADALEGGLLIGEFSPECTEEGKYMEVQCSGSTGYCWCVDIETGVTKQGTDVRGTPDCSAPVPTCEGDLTYQTCGSACPSVCNQPEQICIFSCSVGCQCPPGMYLVPGEDPPRCVDFADCPAEPTCEGDLVYQSCGTACPSVCNVPPPQACTSQCVSECQCPYGEYRVPDENPPRCVPYEECPTPACDNGMHFEICGKECPNYCGKPDDEYCISFCKPGCVCPEGTILIDLETDMCVPQEDCPGAIIPVAVETVLRVDFQCPAKRGRCPYGLAESTDLACTVECGDDYDCEGERKCCSHTCGSICTYPDFPVPQPDPSRFPPVPTSPPAMGISADMCPAADVAPASCGLTCSADKDCSSGELCCTNNACEGSVCLPFVTEQMCTTVPCPVFEASGPRDFEQKICGSDYIFIVKIRSDGRAKILDDLKWRSNPYADASNRPIISFIMDDVCTFQMTKERYVLFMDGNAADMDTKELTLDHTVLVIPLTGHLKNDVKMLSDRCPIA